MERVSKEDGYFEQTHISISMLVRQYYCMANPNNMKLIYTLSIHIISKDTSIKSLP